MAKITVCVDRTIVTLRKVVLSGWVVSDHDTPVDITTNIRKAKIQRLNRVDIAHAHGSSDPAVGFQIETSSFRRMNVFFACEDEAKVLSYSCLNLRRKRILQVMRKIIQTLRKQGVKTVAKMILYRLQGKVYIEKGCEDYEAWYANHAASEETLAEQRTTNLSYQPLISIIVPVYNTPVVYLREAIAFVEQQSYTHWELILVDGHSTKKETLDYLKQLQNSKIKVIHLAENRMISENTNAGIRQANGAYIALLDHDDLLTKDALYCMAEKLNEEQYDLIYSDEDKVNSSSTHLFQPHFKPDFCIDTLRSYNYITHFTILKKSMLDEIGLFDAQCDGAQDYDMFLRFAARTSRIAHIPRILYHWRIHEDSTAQDVSAKAYVLDAGKRALRKHLNECHLTGAVMDGLFPTAYRIYYDLQTTPLISIIIPNKDHVNDLKNCIDSILERSFYQNYEILIVENNSTEKATFEYYDALAKHERIQVLHYKKAFNYSAINNFAAAQAKGEYLVLLNNDIEILTGTWLEEMLMHAQRAEVGAVGAKLYYPNDTIQHAGVIIGIGGVAGHSHKYYPREDDGYFGRLKIVQNVSAVTAACLMVAKEKYEQVGGFDEGYQVAFNDVDFCMKLNEHGYHCIFTPFAEMIHYESLSRGAEDSPEKIARFNSEIQRFEARWGLWREDPCYNLNLSITHEDFSLRQ